MEIKTEELKEAFAIVDQVSPHSGLLSSQYLKLTGEKDQLHLSVTGLVVAGATVTVTPPPSTWPKAFFLDRRILGAFLGGTRAEKITLDMDAKRLLLRSGHHKVQIGVMDDVRGYEHWEGAKKPDTTLTLTDGVLKDVGMLASYAPVTVAADHLSAVYLVKGYGILATDSFILAAVLSKKTPETFPLPVTLAALLAGFPKREVTLQAKQGAALQLPTGYLYQTISARCVKSYPTQALQKIVATAMAEKAGGQVGLSHLQNGIGQVGDFIFGSSDAFLEFAFQPDSKFGVLTTKLLQGLVTRKVAATAAAAITFRWPVAPVLRWVEYLAKADKDKQLVISCGRLESGPFLRCTAAGKQYLLLMAETV